MKRRNQKTVVVKLGGSTLGSHDTTLDDLVTLQRRGVNVVVVHGGGKVVSQWLERHGITPRFQRGLRVTDADTLKVATAVLAGLVNKELVADLQRRGGKALGLSCADGGLVQSRIKDKDLGYVGEVSHVDAGVLETLLAAGFMPVVAPVSLLSGEGSSGAGLANVNGDTIAGALAASLGADKLVFLTDVPGIFDVNMEVMPVLTVAEAASLLTSGAVVDGMLPKLESCLNALTAVEKVRVIDGRVEHALLSEMEGQSGGTTVTR